MTADMSTIDSGVTAAAMATAGGPWTVNSLSYNYRSARLTANTPITTGASYAYDIDATDQYSNSGSQGYTVAIESYSAVIAATTGIVSHWRFGEAAGAATAVDGPGTNNGTYVNAPGLGQAGALAGDSNTAAGFDGANDHVSVPDNATLALGDGPMSFEVWVKRNDNAAGYKDILHKGANSYQWAFNAAGNRFTKASVADISVYASAGDQTVYYHWVYTKNGAANKLYRNGIDVTPAITNQALANTASALYFATNNGSGEFLNARLDELAIYNQVLSKATALDHYNAGIGNR